MSISIFKNWGDDVVAIINGQVITKADILDDKRRRQRHLLEGKLADNVWRAAFVWVFRNEGPFFGGWWLYIRTLRDDYRLNHSRSSYRLLFPKIMALYPCGFEPNEANFEQWAEVFASAHHRATVKRPANNGLAIARALISPGGQLLDVAPWEAVREEESV